MWSFPMISASPRTRSGYMFVVANRTRVWGCPLRQVEFQVKQPWTWARCNNAKSLAPAALRALPFCPVTVLTALPANVDHSVSIHTRRSPRWFETSHHPHSSTWYSKEPWTPFLYAGKGHFFYSPTMYPKQFLGLVALDPRFQMSLQRLPTAYPVLRASDLVVFALASIPVLSCH